MVVAKHNTADYDSMKLITFKEKMIFMEEHVKVLDHGYVEFKGSFGTEEDIIRAARMSTDKGFLGWGGIPHSFQERTKDKLCDFEKWNPNAPAFDGDRCEKPKELHEGQGDEKLLEYLYKNQHMTPFEMCSLRFEVKAPIMVFREWHRHRTQKFNEMSGRYVQMPDEHYIPEPRLQDTKNKQGSTENTNPAIAEYDSSGYDVYTAKDLIEKDQDRIYAHYERMLEAGIAKEVARINTPISRYSKMWCKTDLRNWLHFLNLRMRPNAQKEIRLYANAIAEMIKFIYPRTYALFEEHTLYAVTLSKSEAEWLIRQRNCLEVYEEEHKMKGQIWSKLEAANGR